MYRLTERGKDLLGRYESLFEYYLGRGDLSSSSEKANLSLGALWDIEDTGELSSVGDLQGRQVLFLEWGFIEEVEE